jgi:TRAP-type C4-dicarboxylate transport system substrate-binding protein
MRTKWNGWVVCTAILVWALAAPPAEAAKISMKLGHIRADTSPTHKAAVKFAEVVGQKTNGDVEIKVFPNSQLGGILDMFTGMKAGSLEMVYGGINTYGFIKGGEVFQITAVPFLYRDYEHMQKVLTSHVFHPPQAAEKATGVRSSRSAGYGPAQLTTGQARADRR